MAKIVRNMPMAEYLAHPAIDNSYLGNLQRSPMFAKYCRENPQSTPAMALGSLIHTMILEPDDVRSRYYMMPDCDGRTKEGKALKAQAEAEAGAREVVAQKAWTRAETTAICVKAHPAAFALLSASKDRELSIFWTDAETGIECKARLDAIALMQSLGLAVDVKSTADASPAAFAKSIANYSYHRQGSFYLEAGNQAGFNVGAFCIIAVESDEPFGVACYRLDDAALDEGRSEWRRLLKIEAECRKNNRWPAYSDEVQTIGIPRWAFKEQSFTGEIKF